LNYFQLYNLPVSFNIDKLAVKQAYFKLSKKYHPDFISNGTEAEKEEALQMSATINKAYKIFCNQDELIKYVLWFKENIAEEEKYQLPNDFLMEVMELNESLTEAIAANNTDEIIKQKALIESFKQTILSEVEELLQRETIEEINSNEWQKIKEYYFKKKYLNRILDSIA
jgi:molecular chaperone HscB